MLNKEYTYLLIDVCCIVIPLIASFHPKSPFYKDWKYYLPANLVVTALFLVWDYYFTLVGIWGFNTDYTSGIMLLNLPLEEVLFFICIPYACTYTWYVFGRHVQVTFPTTATRIGYAVTALMGIVTVLYTPKLYTSITALLLALLLGFLLMKKPLALDRFLLVYGVILIPFFISNGLLTGSYLEQPIVWYNDDYNMGIRMFTIPVEDAFYAMLMLLANITGYELLKKRFGSIQTLETINA